jgi:hypothetical protein
VPQRRASGFGFASAGQALRWSQASVAANEQPALDAAAGFVRFAD